MKPAAIGIRVHSGWGALVALALEGGAERVIERRRITVASEGQRGAVQPYHFAEQLELRAAEKYITSCAANSKRLALAELGELVERLHSGQYQITGAAILMSSGRPLPEFAKILASHALIHAAEGEFFRGVFREALEELPIPVTGIRERELFDHVSKTFGESAASLRKRIEQMGRSLGPPWTADQKNAALAAAIVLASIHGRRNRAVAS